MQPVDGLFIALLVVLTVGALIMTVWSWNWARLRFARRVFALAFSQVMVVLCVVAGVNASQDFFVTWDDVFTGGAAANPDAVPVTALAPPANSGAIRQAAAVAAESQLQPAVDAAEQSYRQHPGHGVMVATQIRGARTGYALPARLYLPAAYFDQSDPDRVFPVVEFLTGYYGGLDIFQRTFGGDRMLDKLIAEKKMAPVVVVIPEQNPSLPRDSECVNAVGGDQAETYLAMDVPDVIRNDLRVSRNRSRWTLLGYSTGGFCSANIAIHHPDRFSTVVSLSGYFHAVTDSTTGDLYKGSEKTRLANTPSHTVTLPRSLPLNFYLATTTGDGEGVGGLKELSPKITAPDKLTVAVNGTSGHNFSTWRRELPLAFTWLGGQLRKPVTPAHPAKPGGHGAARVEAVGEASPNPAASPSTVPGPAPSTSVNAAEPGLPALALPPADTGGAAATGAEVRRAARRSVARAPEAAASATEQHLFGPTMPPPPPPSGDGAATGHAPRHPAGADPAAAAVQDAEAQDGVTRTAGTPDAAATQDTEATPAGLGWPNVWLPSNGLGAAGCC